MENKKKVLVVLANEFPYGKNEAYMESEIAYWSRFDEVYLFSLQLRKISTGIIRKVPDNVIVIPVRINLIGYILCAFDTCFDRNFYAELKRLINSKNFTVRTFAQVLLYVSRAHYESKRVIRKLKENITTDDDVVFYSYRFGYQPYVAILADKKLKCSGRIYSRAHGYDLYDNRKKSGYIPFRNIVLNRIEKCYPCSEDGSLYLKAKYPLYADKIETKYLGTVDHGYSVTKRSDVFQLVSCSNMTEVKRVNIIVEALSHIKNVKIRWTHFGEGPLFDSINKMAQEQLHANIEVDWRGSVSNKLILKEYGEGKFNLFINVSSSEGLPVSIMEAASAGIPCIATDVGGTSEIVEDGINGLLLQGNVMEQEVCDNILRFINMSDEDYARFCMNARDIWMDKFNADKNYQAFVEEIYYGDKKDNH